MPSLSIEDAYSKIFDENPEEESKDFEIKEETSPQKKKRRKDKSTPKSNNICIRPQLNVSEKDYFIFSISCLMKGSSISDVLSDIVSGGIRKVNKDLSEDDKQILLSLFNMKNRNNHEEVL